MCVYQVEFHIYIEWNLEKVNEKVFVCNFTSTIFMIRKFEVKNQENKNKNINNKNNYQISNNFQNTGYCSIWIIFL